LCPVVYTNIRSCLNDDSKLVISSDDLSLSLLSTMSNDVILVGSVFKRLLIGISHIGVIIALKSAQ